ncbi:polysaccharide deacetylase family protein [Secundilactobacillus muriivasis]
MTKTNRKWLLGIFLVLFVSVLSVNVYKKVTFERGIHENFALASADQQIKNGIMVLCYHRILNDTAAVSTMEHLTPNNQLHAYNVNLSEFKQQMTFLQRHHVRVISTAQMVTMLKKHRTVHGKYAVITFDDVDRTLTENAAPVLKRHGYPFTASIITGTTGRYIGGEQLASWPEVLKMKRQVGGLLTLGVHTNNMHYLVKGTPVFNLRKHYLAFKQDYATSQRVLKAKTGQTSPIFTYPYGSGTSQVENFLLTQRRLQVIYTLNNGIVTSRSNLKLTPRMIVNRDSWKSIAKWLE